MNKNVDFLPEDYIEKKAQQRTNVICLVLFLLVTAGVGGGFAVTEQRQRKIDKRSADINREMLQVGESLKQLEVLETKRKEMMRKASISASLMEPVPRSLLLATITNNLPVGLSLLSYELKCKDASPKAENTRSRNKKGKRKITAKSQDKSQEKTVEARKWETTIELSGLAMTDIQVAELIGQLNDSALINQVNLIFSEEKEVDEEMLRHFKLMVKLDPKVRASEEDVALARQKGVSGM